MNAVPIMGGNTPGCQAVGRRGLPREYVLRIYADYLRLGSVRAAARLHNRSPQALDSLFHTHELVVTQKSLKRKRWFNGRSYTQDAQGYWRDTVYRGRRARDGVNQLHHVIWIARHGPIPAGRVLVFRDGNRDHCELANLELVSRAEQVRRRATFENGATKTAAARLGLLLAGAGRKLVDLAQ